MLQQHHYHQWHLQQLMGLTGVPMAIGALSVMGSSFMNGVFFHRMGFGDRKQQ